MKYKIKEMFLRRRNLNTVILSVVVILCLIALNIYSSKEPVKEEVYKSESVVNKSDKNHEEEDKKLTEAEILEKYTNDQPELFKKYQTLFMKNCWMVHRYFEVTGSYKVSKIMKERSIVYGARLPPARMTELLRITELQTVLAFFATHEAVPFLTSDEINFLMMRTLSEIDIMPKKELVNLYTEICNDTKRSRDYLEQTKHGGK